MNVFEVVVHSLDFRRCVVMVVALTTVISNTRPLRGAF